MFMQGNLKKNTIKKERIWTRKLKNNGLVRKVIRIYEKKALRTTWSK